MRAEQAERSVVLVPCDFYLPGYRCGGVARSIANTVELLGDDLRFLVVTRDHDDGMTTPYELVDHGLWQRRGKARVLYLSRRALAPLRLARLLRSIPHDVLYLNSIFSRPFSIWPLLLRRVGGMPARRLLIAPNGELAPPALASKPVRKRLYLMLARALRLHAAALWRVSSQAEGEDVRRCFGRAARVEVVPNLLPRGGGSPARRFGKRPGRLDLVYLSRVTGIKNLHRALRLVARVKGKVRFDIYGPRDDDGYWRRCEEAIAALPNGVDASYRGPLTPEQVRGVLARYDLLVLPSASESFCYVVPEALAAGCPVLISDRTPWRHLAASRAGWDLPVADEEAFAHALQRCTDMEEAEHRLWRDGARALVRRIAALEDRAARQRALLEAPPRVPA